MASENECPRKRTWMTPCVLEDGPECYTDDGRCIGCNLGPEVTGIPNPPPPPPAPSVPALVFAARGADLQLVLDVEDEHWDAARSFLGRPVRLTLDPDAGADGGEGVGE